MPADDATPRRKPALKQGGAAGSTKASNRQAWFISALQAQAFKSISDPAGLQVGYGILHQLLPVCCPSSQVGRRYPAGYLAATCCL
jgi:hypothetical protein